MPVYVIYVKTKAMRRLTALDVENGLPVANLIRATIFSTRGAAEQCLSALRGVNTTHIFEVRKNG